MSITNEKWSDEFNKMEDVDKLRIIQSYKEDMEGQSRKQVQPLDYIAELLVEILLEAIHNAGAETKFSQGYTCLGEDKSHPDLVPAKYLSQDEVAFDRATAECVVRAMINKHLLNTQDKATRTIIRNGSIGV